MSEIPIESIQSIAETNLGISNIISEDVAKAVAREVEYRIRELTQVFLCLLFDYSLNWIRMLLNL